MSVFTDWEMAKNQIQSGDPLGYPSAEQYYAKLKQRFIQQIMIHNQLMNIDEAVFGKEIEQGINEIKMELENGKTLFELSNESLQNIKQWLIAQFEGDNGQQLLSLGQELSRLKAQEKEEQVKNTKRIKEIQQEIRTLLDTSDKVLEVAKKALNQYNTTAADYGSVFSFLSSFMVNMVGWMAEQGLHNAYIIPQAKTTLLGYYKEIIEKKLLLQFFENSGFGPGVELVGGKNTINDLLIPFDNLNQTFSTDEMIGILEKPVEDQMISMGAQIKAKSIAEMKDGQLINKIGTEFMKISHQASLKEAFNLQIQGSVPSDGFNKNSWCCGVIFLGQMNNILQTFGNNNVIFISGNYRFFMDEFIKYFRSQNMYLAFQMDAQGRATSQVGLQRFMNAKNTQLIKRFR